MATIGWMVIMVVDAITTRQMVFPWVTIILLEGYFSATEQFFDFVAKLLPVYNMAYSCMKKC